MTLEAVEAVCEALGDEMEWVFDAVASLIGKSLLQQTEHEGEQPRLVMLETIREFGLEALAVSGEMEATRQAHAGYYLTLAENAESEYDGPHQTNWFDRLEREHDNLRAALSYFLEREEARGSIEMALRLSGGLWKFWLSRSHKSEGWTELSRALARSEGIAASTRAKALILLET